MNRIVALFSFLSFAAIALLAGSGCANIIPPTGGPRDSIPPAVLNITPPDSTVNFRGDRIVFNFDEYVTIQDERTNFLFTPLFDTIPEVSIKGRVLTVRFRSTLAVNTTYILNFGNAIRDVNESNVLRDFVYTFSTGPALDSLELKGNVRLAQTGGVDSTMIVVLHRNLSDSAVLNSQPTYISRLDKDGNFRFKNLPAGPFAIYALGNVAGRRFDRNQLFAFADAPVEPGKTGSITLNAYRENPPNTTTTRPQSPVPGTERRLQFSTNLNNNQQDIREDLTLTFNTPLRSFDSTRIALLIDSTFQRVTYTTKLDSTRKQLAIRTAWQQGRSYNLVLNRDFAQDTAGRQLLKSDTLTFNTRKATDYGNLVVRFKNVDTTLNPVLQLLQNNQVVFSAPIRQGIVAQQLFTPGEYTMQVLYDRNRNGIWDPGQFFGGKRQPEIVRPLERKLSVKPAWDNEFDITL